MNRITTTLISVGICSPYFVASQNKSGTTPRPNILFCIADDASFAHFGANGCRWVNTPAYDYVVQHGINFVNSYTPNAKSAPSRAVALTGRNSWQLEEIGNHSSIWPENKYLTFVEALAEHGYRVGYTGKGWGPGNPGMRRGVVRQITGKEYNSIKCSPPSKYIGNDDYAKNFEQFLDQKPLNQSFCFWYGGREPHREYEYGVGIRKGGKQLSDIDKVPSFWPDNDTIRTDMLDYAFEVEYFDSHIGRMIKLLQQKDLLENTIIIITSDNGMPFPRSKGLQYESSNHMPYAAMWLNGIKDKGREEHSYVSFIDIAPTLIQAAGIAWDKSGMQPTPGKSLIDLFQNKKIEDRSYILLGQERHDFGRPLNQGYPIRSIIKDGFLYCYNFKPDLWPVGNPETGYLNTDGSPTKTNILNLRRSGIDTAYWNLCFGKHSQEELFQISVDKNCILNLADLPEYARRKEMMRKILFDDLKKQKDPRLLGQGDVFDKYPFYQPDSKDYYERFIKGEAQGVKLNWVNETDFEQQKIK